MKKRVLILLLLILFPIKIFALSGSVSISCPTTTLEQDKTYTCSLKGYSNEEVSALTAKLSSSSNLSITNVQTSSIWQGNGSGGSIDLYTDTNKNGTFNIATFNIKLTDKNSSSLTINSIKFSDANFKDHSIASKTISFSVKQEVTTTKKNTTTPTKQTSATTKTDIKTTKSENQKDNNTNLKELSISSVNLNFNSNKTNYNVDVSNDINEVTIKAISESDKAKVVSPNNLKLNIGENNLLIKVVAEDGSYKEYKIVISRLSRKLSSNSNLKDLEVSGIKLNFDNKIKSYNLGTVKKDKLDIKYLVEDEKTKVYIYGNENLSKNDAIVIKVIAEDSSVSEYILYVNNISKNKGIILVLSLLSIVLLTSIIIVTLYKKKS